MTLLVAGPELLLAVSNQEDVFVSRRSLDVIGEFLDIFISELIEEVDDESAGYFIDLNPGFLHLAAVSLNHTFSLIGVVLVELFGLNDVETEEIIFADNFLTRLGRVFG